MQEPSHSGSGLHGDRESRSELVPCTSAFCPSGRLMLCLQGSQDIGSVGQGCRRDGPHRCFGLESVGKPRNIKSNVMRLMQEMGPTGGWAEIVLSI